MKDRLSYNEEYGFSRTFFPVDLRGHEIHVLHNEAHTTVEDRLQLHLTLHCPKCDTDYTIRGRLPPECEQHTYRAALAKFVALGYFTKTCDKITHKTYYGP